MDFLDCNFLLEIIIQAQVTVPNSLLSVYKQLSVAANSFAQKVMLAVSLFSFSAVVLLCNLVMQGKRQNVQISIDIFLHMKINNNFVYKNTTKVIFMVIFPRLATKGSFRKMRSWFGLAK